MRRTIAVALAVVLLFAGGCGRQQRRGHQPAAVSTQTPAVPAAATTSTGTAGTAGTNGTAGDVDQLLDQVEQQLSGDAQPADDED
ncbi:hypothetical protein ACQEVZ_17915 [Dactylosporangium sp. CA-152071]|uniref:hypothetical protein n=1 Tax=Dactylosporangium sp. CA-152071 TaxID=3239933 RepID=UPI003D8F3C24